MSLKTPPGAQGVGNAPAPLTFQGFLKAKQHHYMNSVKPSHLNSKFAVRGKIIALVYCAFLVPVSAWTYNTNRKGAKKPWKFS